MLRVITKANPAELVVTLRAGHVHASLIFLDRICAPRARFCVQLDPSFCIIIGASHALFPLSQHVTVNRPMRWFQASKTKILSTFAKNVSLISGRVAHNLFALWIGAPLGVFTHVYVGVFVVLYVFLKLSIWKQLSE
jgi:hypothetical protein